MKIQVVLFFVVSFAISYKANSQAFPNSPYSYYGIGDIVPKGFGQQLMVGGTGIANRNATTINNTNPAAYSAIVYPYSFIAETGLSVTSVFRSNSNESNLQTETKLPYLAIAFKTGAKSGASFGLRQYSNVDYNVGGTGSFTGLNEEYAINYIGEGGLNEIYFGWSKSWIKNLSLGLSGSFIFGQVIETQFITPANNLSVITIEDQQFINGLNLNAGLQYVIPIKNSNLTIGATASPFSDLNEDRELLVTNTVSGQDFPDTLVNDGIQDLTDYSVPLSFGFGLSWASKKFKISTDYTTQQWSGTDIEGRGFEVRNSHRFSAGMQKLPNYQAESLLGQISWGIGSYYNLSYLSINNTPLNTLGFTAGLSIPVGKNKGIARIIVENATRGEADSNSFSENMTRFTLSFSILESWFRKRVFD